MTIRESTQLGDYMTTEQLPVAQFMNAEILNCEPDMPLYKAAVLMAESRCSSIIIVEGGKAIGIWTEKDALNVDFTNSTFFDLPIRESMSTPVRKVNARESMQKVALVFQQYSLRHLLVVNDAGEHVGVVSQSDVVWNHGIENFLRLRNVKSVSTRPMVRINENDSLNTAVIRMRELRVDAVVVRYEDGENGILTERDIVRYIAEQRVEETVGELASRPLISIPEETSLYKARNYLSNSGLRHIGVKSKNGGLQGVVSFADIMTSVGHGVYQELALALHERDRALNLSKRNLRLAEKIIESSPQRIIITDKEGMIESVNPAFTKVTGYKLEDVVGKTPSILSSGRHDEHFYRSMWHKIQTNGYWQGEIWNRRRNGEDYPELLTITAIHDESGELTHYASISSDISDLKESEEKIKHLAYYDPLTKLPNRRLLNDRLSMAVAHAHRSGTRLAVMFLDLDLFKRINDSLGHSVGDELLRNIATRLKQVVREDDTVARMGGDEFVLILSETDSVDDTVNTARRVIDELKKPVLVDGNELVVTCSIGVSFYPDDGTDNETLIKNADTAMYRTKELGRNSYQLYSPSMNASTLEHLIMEAGLRNAIEKEEFELFYQPLNNAQTNQLVGAEALMRWKHPEMGYIAPSDFIPLAEETGLIIPMGEWALRNACRQLNRWHAQGHDKMRIAINISACQFKADNFLANARSIIDEEKIDPEFLTFELTESMLMDDALESIRRLTSIHGMGVTISLDDFGTCYSSLAYLKRFPINALKIDRMFIHDITKNSNEAAIVSALISLAHSLDLKVVAEGVEEKSQLEYLRSEGCDEIQGFYYGQPVNAHEFQALHMKRVH